MGFLWMPSTIGDVLVGHAARDPAAAAIVCPELGTLTFGELGHHVRHLGEQFATAGITPESRVGIALQRGPEAALLSVAVCCAATLVPLNPNLPPAQLQAGLARLLPDALRGRAAATVGAWVP